jgi:hypothetical protein
MRRAFAGLRAARVRPDKGVRVTLAAAGIVFLAACAPTDGSGHADPAGLTPASIEATTAAPTTSAPTTTAAPATTSATPAPTTTPAAKPTVVPKPIAPPLPKPVPKPRPVPKPAPKPAPKPVPKPAPKPAPSTCDPSYPDVCLKDGIGDYDCSSGSGNGPNYVTGPVRVLSPDPFGLDANHDGVGCEKG